jgi:hypothetical protein
VKLINKYYLKAALLLLAAWTVSYCLAAESEPAELRYYLLGKSVQIRANADSILQNVNRLVVGCDTRYRLAVDSNFIESLLKNETCLEILYPSEFVLSTLEPPKYRISKILIPFTGLYATDEKSNAPVIYLGNEEYFSGPIGNSQGLDLRRRIKALLKASEPEK